jgi:glycerol kinase
MNLATRQWDSELCRLFGIPMEALAPIVPTAGAELGTIGRVPLTASVVDQQAALYGHGCRRRGDAKITFGTGAFALVVTGEEIIRAPEIGLLPTVAWRIGTATTYAVDGGVYDAGATVEWLMRLGLLSRFEDLDAFEAPAAIGRGLAFVPALSGLACPWWDRSAAGLWLGMSADTSREDLCQAALEGIALRTVEVIGAMDTRLGLAVPISIDGGLTRSRYFTRFLADILDKPLISRGFDEMTAFGCAALAALALGLELAPPTAGDERLEPMPAERVLWQGRFSDAVQRARGWRLA